MTESEKPFPPSLSRVVSALYTDGTPRPEADVKADLAKRAADKARRKKNGYARNSHWSERRMFYAKEARGFHDTLTVLLGKEEAFRIRRGMGWPGGNSRIAAEMVLKRARPQTVLIKAARGRGRPQTPDQRRVAMMVSVEAYMGSGLTQEQALSRAHTRWGGNITRVRFDDIYFGAGKKRAGEKKAAKLPHDGGSDLLRSFFLKIKTQEVDQFIDRIRKSEADS